jgi:hypothetical protein
MGRQARRLLIVLRCARRWDSELMKTFEDVLAALRAYRGQFVIRADGSIRHGKTNLCPLCQLAKDRLDRLYPSYMYNDAGHALGLTLLASVQVAGAADSYVMDPASYSADRKALCDALGL